MKKFLSVFVLVMGLTAIGLEATASPPKNDVRLSFNFREFHDFHVYPVVGVTSVNTLNVYKNGAVYFIRKGSPLVPTKGKLVTRLSIRERREMEHLISKAQQGDIVHPQIQCKAIPVEMRNYLANNSRLILSVGGYSCGVKQYNNSPAAEELVDMLNELREMAENE